MSNLIINWHFQVVQRGDRLGYMRGGRYLAVPVLLMGLLIWAVL